MASTGIRYDNIAINQFGTALGGALVSVCNFPGVLTACTVNDAAIFQDINLSIPQSNPFAADAIGNYGFFAAAGNYNVTVTHAGVAAKTLTVTLAAGSSGGSLDIRPLNNIFTGTNQFNGVTTFKSASPWYDVKAFGAVGDGVTDDTSAITGAIAAWKTTGGVLHFSTNVNGSPYKFNGNVFNIAPHGWLYVLMDASFLLTGPITPTSYTAFVGRAGGFEGLGGQANLHPNVTWLPTGSGIEALNLTGNQGAVYFEGVNFENTPSSTSSAVHFHSTAVSGGPTFIVFEGCQLNSNSSTVPALLVDTDTSTITGVYGVFFRYCAIAVSQPGNSSVMLINNSGIFRFDSCAIYGAPVILNNNGVSAAGSIYFHTIVSEALVNQNFLVVNGTSSPITEIVLENVTLADTVGTVYMLKTTGNVSQVHINMSVTAAIGTGLVDPTSNSVGSFHCEGYGCDQAVSIALGNGSTGVFANQQGFTGGAAVLTVLGTQNFSGNDYAPGLQVTGFIQQAGLTFANLLIPPNGTYQYCSDCTIANPCASGGTGAFAKRLNGVWVCN